MASRAFPVVYARQVAATVGFYELLGFRRHFQFPPDGEPGYVGLRRDADELGVVASAWPRERYGATIADGVRFELFVYVDDVDATIEALRGQGVAVLREPEDMPWGERLGYVADPAGNPVALAHAAAAT